MDVTVRLRCRLPTWPLSPTTDGPAIVVGEVHHPVKAIERAAPEWLTIPERGLYTGVAIFGAVGSGKTSACMHPFARQLLSWHTDNPERRVAAPVLEVKGDFCHDIRRMLAELGRADDYIELSLDGRLTGSPLSATWLDSYSLPYTVASLLNQLFGKGKEPFWQQAYTNLVRWIIGLCRVLPGGWVTLRDRHALRHRSDHIVVGEDRGAEAADLSQAIDTGHGGSLAHRAREFRDGGALAPGACASRRVTPCPGRSSAAASSTASRPSFTGRERPKEPAASPRWCASATTTRTRTAGGLSSSGRRRPHRTPARSIRSPPRRLPIRREWAPATDTHRHRRNSPAHTRRDGREGADTTVSDQVTACCPGHPGWHDRPPDEVQCVAINPCARGALMRASAAWRDEPKETDEHARIDLPDEPFRPGQTS